MTVTMSVATEKQVTIVENELLVIEHQADLTKLDETVDELKSYINSYATSPKPISQLEIKELPIQELLERILVLCYLLQEQAKLINNHYSRTLDDTLEHVTKSVSDIQKDMKWVIPAMLSAGVSGAAGFGGDKYGPAVKGLGDAFGGVKEVVQNLNNAKQTPESARMQQLNSVTENRRQEKQTISSSIEKALDNLKQSLEKISQAKKELIR
ncbi:hypothetical protein N9Y92_01515 [Chlamydiales bacterium]|nr:hypothetical protein [Chlamydiales bacterium]